MSQQINVSLRSMRLITAAAGLAGAVVASGWLLVNRPAPAEREHVSAVPEVAVTRISPQPVNWPVIGYGTVRPKKRLNVVPQVTGQLTHVHPNLLPGRVIQRGEVLFEIDGRLYDSRLRQAEAEAAALEAGIARQDKERESLATRLANARASLAIEESDYQSAKDLYDAQQVGMKRDVDQLRYKYLRAKDMVDELVGRETTLPFAITQAKAELEAARARVAQARQDLEHTRIECPFRARVESVHVGDTQVVTAFFSIAELTDMEAFELTVGVDPRDLRWLDRNVHPNSLTEGAPPESPAVVLRSAAQGQHLHWNGHVTRFERVDERTRTAQLVVEVREADLPANGAASFDDRPTLSIGMHCRAELPGRRIDDAILVPRHAIHDDRFVYVVVAGGDAALGRLAERVVHPLRSFGDLVLVGPGEAASDEAPSLQGGELVMTSPLSNPIDGMVVRVREASAATRVGPSEELAIRSDRGLDLRGTPDRPGIPNHTIHAP